MTRRRSRRTLWIRVFAGFALGAAVLGGLALVNQAQASLIGGLTLDPASDSTTTNGALNFSTTATCPAPSTKFIVRIYGSGLGTAGVNLVGNTSLALASSGGGYSYAIGNTLHDALLSKGVTAPSGAYAIDWICTENSGLTNYGAFVSNISFTPVAGPDLASYTSAPASAPAKATSTTMSVSPSGSAESGQTVSMTASVSPSSAVGAVQFSSGGTPIGSPVPVSGGVATLSQPLASGAYSLVATFVPTNPADYLGSASSGLAFTVHATPTTTAISATPASPVVANQPVHVTATIAPATAAGVVQFTLDGVNVGVPVSPGGGTASSSISMPTGTHHIGAVFTPADASLFAGAAASPVAYTVNQAPTKTVLGLSTGATAPYGTNPVLTATITPDAAGTVQFMDGATVMSAPVTVADGRAVLTPTGLAIGPHSFSAVFTPANAVDFGGSTSAPVQLTIETAPTTTTLSVTPASGATASTTFQMTATVSPAAEGTVTFSSNGTTIGSAPVNAGKATLSGALPAGSYNLVAAFTSAFAQNYANSTSAARPYVVADPGTSAPTPPPPAAPPAPEPAPVVAPAAGAAPAPVPPTAPARAPVAAAPKRVAAAAPPQQMAVAPATPVPSDVPSAAPVQQLVPAPAAATTTGLVPARSAIHSSSFPWTLVSLVVLGLGVAAVLTYIVLKRRLGKDL